VNITRRNVNITRRNVNITRRNVNITRRNVNITRRNVNVSQPTAVHHMSLHHTAPSHVASSHGPITHDLHQTQPRRNGPSNSRLHSRPDSPGICHAITRSLHRHPTIPPLPLPASRLPRLELHQPPSGGVTGLGVAPRLSKRPSALRTPLGVRARVMCEE